MVLASHLSRGRKQELIRTPWVSPVIALNCAVAFIQARARGIFIRTPLPTRPPKRLRAGTGQLDRYMDARAQGKKHGENGFSEWCAVKIQSVGRMRFRHRVFTMQRYSVYQIASLQIQGTWRDYCQQRYMKLPKRPGTRETPQATAALMIQDQWRRYTNIRIYRYYRDLISFRLVGDPATLLKTICPGEAAMMDAAMGLHVRFRLGGATFPPMMYYKMFLHKPLCDIGAFAPRDYTESRPYPPAKNHNHARDPAKDHPAEYSKSVRLDAIRVGGSYFGADLGGVGPSGTRNWYRRVENNPWRPITNGVLGEIEAPPPGVDVGGGRLVAQGKPFHYLYKARRCRTQGPARTRQQSRLKRRSSSRSRSSSGGGLGARLRRGILRRSRWQPGSMTCGLRHHCFLYLCGNSMRDSELPR